MKGKRPAWMDRGACLDEPPDLFFPARGEDTRPGKAICHTCPFEAECLAYALDNAERWGIWGGTSERERRQMRAERNRRSA